MEYEKRRKIMRNVLIQFAVAFSAFMIIDLAWLGIVARNFYKDQLGPLMAQDTIWASAIAFYILFVIGILYFSVNPGLNSGSFKQTLRNAALYGFFTYMTYELTNYAVIEKWPAGLVIVDIVWGVILSTSVAAITFLVITRLKKKH